MQEQDEQLDELIRVINDHGITKSHHYLQQFQPKSQTDTKKYLPPLGQKLKIDFTTITSKPKFLSFKPWSGQNNVGEQLITQAIRQDIENEEQQLQEEGDYIHDNKIPISTLATSSEIGYFYRFQAGKVKLIKCLLDENGFRDCHSNNKNWSLYWSSSPFKMEVYKSLLPYQKMNHFPNSFHLTRKDLMNKAISKMQLKFGFNHYNFLPKTYILPQQLDQLLWEYNKHPETYIVKPHNRSQGKGITVTNSMEIIYSKLEKYSSLIVSHYIDNPLLINKLKFDLRIYVAITGINPLRIYVYEEGLARFATEEYDSSGYDSQNRRYQHLTNYSINKKNEDFIPSNDQNQQYYGSKWSLSAMKDFLAFNIGKSETSDLFQRVDQIIVKTILAAENLLYTSFQNNVPFINGCFEVLGFDIMIDSNLKPWLIEVNHSPSMNTDSSLDLKIKGNMIADLFTIAGFTPLSNRYLDGGHSKYQSRHYFKVGDKVNQTSIDKFILREVQLEQERSGDWRRVFPTYKNLKYKIYFENDRYFNRLLREKILTYQQITSLQLNEIRKQRRSLGRPSIQNNNKRPSGLFQMKVKKKQRVRFGKNGNLSFCY